MPSPTAPAAPAPTAPAGLSPWGRRLSGRATGLLGTVLAIAATAAEIARTTGVAPHTARDAESAGAVVGAVLTGILLGSVVVMWLAPRAGPWLAGAGFGLAALGGSVVFFLAAVAMLALGRFDVVAARRQRRLAAAWTDAAVLVPRGLDDWRRSAERRRQGWMLLGMLALAVAFLAAAGFTLERGEVREFRARAVEETGWVAAVADDGSTAVVLVGSKALRVPLPSAEVMAGERAEVRHDGVRAELVDDAHDPAWILTYGAAAALAGAAVLLREQVRRRRVRELLGHGGPALRLLATYDSRGGVRLASPTEPGRLIAATDRLIALDDPLRSVREDADAAWNRPLAEVSDDELFELARSMKGGDVPERWTAPTPDRWQRTPVTVAGLAEHGLPVGIQAPDGIWYLAPGVRAAGPVARWRAARTHVRQDGTGTGTGASASASASEQKRMVPRDADPVVVAGTRAPGDADTSLAVAGPPPLTRFARRTGRVLPWALLPVVWALGRWWPPASGGGLVLLCLVLTLYAWSLEAMTALRATGRALVARRPVLSHVYPWALVDDVVAEPRALVVRVGAWGRRPADALLFPSVPGVPLADGAPGPLEAREALLAARGHAVGQPERRARVRRRPSAPALVAVAVCTAWATGALLIP